jgi:hypothetical protein
MLSAWYEALWLQYFVQHGELLRIIKQFDTFTDVFSKPGQNNQASIISRIKIYGLSDLIKQNPFFKK